MLISSLRPVSFPFHARFSPPQRHRTRSGKKKTQGLRGHVSGPWQVLPRGPARRREAQGRKARAGVLPPPRAPPEVAEGPVRPAAASRPSAGPPGRPGPARPAKPRASSWPRAGLERPDPAGGEARAGVPGLGAGRGAAHLLVPNTAGRLHRSQSRQRQRHGAAGAETRADERESGRDAGAAAGRAGRPRGRASGGSRWPPPLPGEPLSSGCARRRGGSDSAPGRRRGQDDDAAPPRPRRAQRALPRPARSLCPPCSSCPDPALPRPCPALSSLPWPGPGPALHRPPCPPRAAPSGRAGTALSDPSSRRRTGRGCGLGRGPPVLAPPRRKRRAGVHRKRIASMATTERATPVMSTSCPAQSLPYVFSLAPITHAATAPKTELADPQGGGQSHAAATGAGYMAAEPRF